MGDGYIYISKIFWSGRVVVPVTISNDLHHRVRILGNRVVSNGPDPSTLRQTLRGSKGLTSMGRTSSVLILISSHGWMPVPGLV